MDQCTDQVHSFYKCYKYISHFLTFEFIKVLLYCMLHGGIPQSSLIEYIYSIISIIVLIILIV